ncbi:MAG TPA: hypothetical protein VGR81_02735 [Candidatus Acidoferrales bacterium]|nr:hypothetical protein [Candidatus Acidoferrales bacterium]
MKFGILALLVCVSSLCWAQAEQQEVRHHGMMHAMEMQHLVSKTAKLSISNNAAAQQMTVRVGPLNLPAHSSHMTVAQPPVFFLTIPFDGWLVAYHPRVIDNHGVPLPNKLLHHTAFYNTARPDFLCHNKDEHIFGAGGEMNDWPAVPGFGYPVRKGDRIRISAMFANPTAKNYPDVFLEVRMDYKISDANQPPLQDVYPAWFDVMGCGDSGYTLPSGESMRTGHFKLRYSGKLLGVGGHLHDYGEWLVLKDTTANITLANLAAKTDLAGHVLAMPVGSFAAQGGVALSKGDVIEVTDAYNNATGNPIDDGAMGIVVGYFLPDDQAALAALRRKPNR